MLICECDENLDIDTEMFCCLCVDVQDYEPSGDTPIRMDTDVPSKVAIESLRAMPMENLLEEFSENHSFESISGKKSRSYPAPRPPLAQITGNVVVQR